MMVQSSSWRQPNNRPGAKAAPTHRPVEISTEQGQGRQRRILASVEIPRPVEQVWHVLTDYEHLADFIPNLARSRQLPHPHGGIRLEQLGTQCFLSIKFCARVVLDMRELFPQELRFSMVEGDFKEFWGAWRLHPLSQADGTGTRLDYELMVLPLATMPIPLIEQHLCRNLRQNLLAICDRTLVCFDPPS
ncbi:hypothetical protein XM38_005050 [Halomicronema hongdechloris C2206]|uniref:Coenzyme Q-binding protein COQ10 START domain-containing protein n=1 Tax=Halomicronema hongdechloris C2206 TaxID=1641165 RepID=A0A1Z3HH52_9CYAN|nr:SRPBCC family protein [Halomicronema hongdechloris]ASC69578.1 hypothetical protein XM38_005050 [Halomicronema hongdechloris C2206]